MVALMLIVSPAFLHTAQARAVFDFDGDGRTDFIIRRLTAVGTPITWYINQSRDGFFAVTWGYDYPPADNISDQEAFGDYDGDGKWDIAVARSGPASPNMIWYVRNSRDGSMTARHWGIAGDIAVPQDYDGDRKTDFAVYRAGWWYILRSRDGQFQAIQFSTGFPDKPFTGGDFDGDRKDDLAVIWDIDNIRRMFVRHSSTGQALLYGLGESQFTAAVAGDYDGDGRADVAILQSIYWRWLRSSDGQNNGGIQWGYAGSTDTPAPGDYDGDGLTDPTVYRMMSFVPGTLYHFYSLQSRDGYLAMQWGTVRDFYPNSRRVIKGTGSIIQPFNERSPTNDKGEFPRLEGRY